MFAVRGLPDPPLIEVDQTAQETKLFASSQDVDLNLIAKLLYEGRADREKYIGITLDPSASPDTVRSAETRLASIVPELDRIDSK